MSVLFARHNVQVAQGMSHEEVEQARVSCTICAAVYGVLLLAMLWQVFLHWRLPAAAARRQQALKSPDAIHLQEVPFVQPTAPSSQKGGKGA